MKHRSAYLHDHGVIVAIVLLALAAGLAQLFFWWLKPQPKEAAFIGPPRSSYVLHDFVMHTYNNAGQPTIQVSAPQLERREGNNSLYMESPIFELPSKQADGPAWKGHATYAWINASGTQIKLHGQVYMHRAAYVNSSAITLLSSEVTLWPKEKRLQTDQPVQFTQGTTRITGTGLLGSLNDNHLEILNDFHGIFLPRSPAKPSKISSNYAPDNSRTTAAG